MALAPSLLKLKTMKEANGKPLRIVQKIAAHDYTTFGMCLLQDENGEEVALLKKNHIHNGAESVTEVILQKWLTSDVPTRTYQHLIECLRQSELGALAELITVTIGQDILPAPQAMEPTAIYTQDRFSVQPPVLIQANTARNSFCLPHSNSSTAPRGTEQALQDSIFLNPYASYLRRLYTSMSQSHTSQHWSHLPRCEFIQLAMISDEELRRGDREEEMVRLAQQGRIETIMSHKQQINVEELFDLQVPQTQQLEVPFPRVILIEGAPGGGKSTLALHICNVWAQHISYGDRFQVVILVYLRDQAVHINSTTLADILPARTLEMSTMVASQIKDCDGQNVLFVFDGWDEFPSHLQKNSLVSTIIREPYKLSLHRSTVVITSRPVSSGSLLHIADRRVEILGFTQHQIHEYIEKALDGNITRIQKLVQHLEEHPVIKGYCYVPLHVAILVHIFLTLKGALPTTLHELFCNLVTCCIARELETRESEYSLVCSLDDLPDVLKSKLSNLSLLAYEGVMQDKVVFYEKDLKLVHLPANLPSLGLLQAVEGLTLFSKSLSYNFLHLSVQELLAAHHISHIDSSEQLKVFKRMFGGSRLQAVLRYYSGFTKLSNPAIHDFILTYSQQQKSIRDLLPLLHCFYEAQEPSLCTIVAPQFSKGFGISDHFSPIDFLVIGYAVSSLSSHVQMKISIVDVDQHRFKCFLGELSKNVVCEVPATEALPGTLQLDLHDQSLSYEKLALLSSHLSQSPIVTNLWIKFSQFYCHDILPQLWEALQFNSSLIELHITQVKVQYQSLDYAYCGSTLKNMLRVNKSLSLLEFSNTVDLGYEACFIFQGLQHNTTLVHLNLSNTGLVATKEIAQALTTMLRVNETLSYFDLSNNEKFAYSGACCIFQGLQHNTALAQLNLSNTGLVATEDTAQALTIMLQVNKTLLHLDLSENKAFLYSLRGINCMLEGLRHNTTLKNLKLRNTGLMNWAKIKLTQAMNFDLTSDFSPNN